MFRDCWISLRCLVETNTFVVTCQAASSPAALVQEHDVDQDDLPSSFAMNIDSSSEVSSDFEQGIISGPEMLVEENNNNEDFVQKMSDEATDFLGALDLPDLPESFDFLPNPDFDIGERGSSPRSSTAADRHTLFNIEAEKPTYKWHQTAGRVYGQEPIILARWQVLYNAGPDMQAYKPFNSRLDWEMAQWAIKENIPQKSFNWLLSIPQVIGFCV